MGLAVWSFGRSTQRICDRDVRAVGPRTSRAVGPVGMRHRGKGANRVPGAARQFRTSALES